MITYLLVFIAINILQGAILCKGYQKAGYKWWQAFVPVWNMIIALKIIERPLWWIALIYLPVIGTMMAIVLIYEWLHTFGYRKKRYTLYTVLSLGLFLVWVMYNPSTQYLGKDEPQIEKNVHKVINATIFAVVAATAIHTYFIQPFVIPTSSLEKTLLVGDFLFVSKVNYGTRVPMTSISAPMVHDTIPLIGVKSYISSIQMPYLRLPALEKIQRNDIVVFNWPADTVRFFRDQSKIHVNKPIDKKSNYVKRAVGIPGDNFQIKQGEIFINGTPTSLPSRAKVQHSYIVKTKPGTEITPQWLFVTYGVTDGMRAYDNNIYEIQSLTDEVANALKNTPEIESVTKVVYPLSETPKYIFPHSNNFKWNQDNIGPFVIPAKGMTINIDVNNIDLYKRIITEYENNTLEINGNSIKINGNPASSYTFKDDYYWMMGDNRNNSEDSRFWGFVPFTHVIGKPLFIWMSIDSNKSGMEKIRWERLFTSVKGEGQPVSYRWEVLIGLILLWAGFEVYARMKKRKTNDPVDEILKNR